MLLISPSPLTARWHSRPDSFQKEPNSLFVCRKAARLAWRVMSVSHAAVMEAEEAWPGSVSLPTACAMAKFWRSRKDKALNSGSRLEPQR